MVEFIVAVGRGVATRKKRGSGFGRIGCAPNAPWPDQAGQGRGKRQGQSEARRGNPGVSGGEAGELDKRLSGRELV